MPILAGVSLKRIITDYQPLAWRCCRRLLPYLGSALILWLLLRQIGLQAVWDLLAEVDGRWLLVGFGWYFFTNICRAYRFGTLLSLPGMREPLRLVPDMIILSFLNNVLPARVGELLFPLLLHQRHRIPIGKSLALLLVARLFDFLAVATLFLVFAFLVRGQLTAVAQQVILTAIIVLAPSLFLLAALPWLGQKGLALFDWFLHGLGLIDTRLGQRLRQFGARVVDVLAQVHHKRTYLKTFGWSILAWLGTFAWFAAFLQAFALPTPYTFVVVGATFAVLANAIPFITVGGFGAHDAGWAFGFSLTGMGWETAVVTGFAVNVLTVLASVVFSAGTVLYFFLGRAISQKGNWAG